MAAVGANLPRAIEEMSLDVAAVERRHRRRDWDQFGSANIYATRARTMKAMLLERAGTHCNDKARLPRILGPALEVASAFGAHLTGLSVTPPPILIPAGMPGQPSTIVVDDHCKAYRRNNPEMRAAFEAACSARNVACAWKEVDAGTHSVADVVVGQAHSADLVIAAQTAHDWTGPRRLDVADHLVLDSGRPVLIIPSETNIHTLPRNIFVAWNGRREAARAVFDALPLLQHADAVRIVCVNPQTEDGTMQSIPGSDICIALIRHGVKCEETQVVRPFKNVGRTLLQQAVKHRADLLVMGCYGHSRAREFVFGGASEYVLRQNAIAGADGALMAVRRKGCRDRA